MLKEVIEFFKRNPDAQYAHVVLDSVFATATEASRARKAWSARMVTVVTRQEYEAAQAGEKVVVAPDGETNTELNAGGTN